MNVRFLSLLLALCMILGTISLSASAVNGDPLTQGDGQVDHVDEPDDDIYVGTDVSLEDLRISADGVAMIQDLEGFVGAPMWDVSQMSIGYGTSTVYAEKYGFSTTNLSETDAQRLLLCVLAEMESKLTAFVRTYKLELTQTQWDALVSFTYNVGTSWLNPNYRLAKLLISGSYTVNEFASAMGVWCHAGTTINNILITRRIREIKLFLYGAYNLDDTENKFCVLKYDANGGDREVDIAFYLEDAPYGSLHSATHKDGLYFQGWYTQEGEKITESTVVSDDLTVSAQWGDQPAQVEMDFTDVKDTDWFVSYVQELYSHSIIDGYPDKTFRPSRTVTTGEALKMILLAAGYGEPERVASHWARGYLNLALDEGIIDSGEIRDLDIPITRALMAKVVARSMGLARLNTTEPFTDTDNVYACILRDHGISDGYTDGTFQPNRSLTRAELATIVCRMYNN